MASNDKNQQESGLEQEGVKTPKTRHVSEKFVQLNNNGVYNISSKPNKDGDVVTTTAVSTVTTTEDRDQAGDSWVCRKCSTIFKDDGGRILECEICHIHTCAKCLKLTNAQYHTTQREDLMWIWGRFHSRRLKLS